MRVLLNRIGFMDMKVQDRITAHSSQDFARSSSMHLLHLSPPRPSLCITYHNVVSSSTSSSPTSWLTTLKPKTSLFLWHSEQRKIEIDFFLKVLFGTEKNSFSVCDNVRLEVFSVFIYTACKFCGKCSQYSNCWWYNRLSQIRRQTVNTSLHIAGLAYPEGQQSWPDQVSGSGWLNAGFQHHIRRIWVLPANRKRSLQG
jgi:hypothetical protein